MRNRPAVGTNDDRPVGSLRVTVRVADSMRACTLSPKTMPAAPSPSMPSTIRRPMGEPAVLSPAVDPSPRAAAPSPVAASLVGCLATAWRETGTRAVSAVAVTGPSSATARRIRRRVASARAVKTSSRGSTGAVPAAVAGSASGDGDTGGHEQQLEPEDAAGPPGAGAPPPRGRPAEHGRAGAGADPVADGNGRRQASGGVEAHATAVAGAGRP